MDRIRGVHFMINKPDTENLSNMCIESNRVKK